MANPQLLHTDAIQQNLVPSALTTPHQKNFIFADEADLLNVALFGKTARQWRDENPAIKGNIRDIATIEQLIVYSNYRFMIRQKSSQRLRIFRRGTERFDRQQKKLIGLLYSQYKPQEFQCLKK